MQFNVAQLLKADVGTAIQSDIHEESIQLDSDLHVLGPINGHARLRRTNQGILADGWVDLILQLTCDRCLKDFEQPMHVIFNELFYPTVEINTGFPLAAPIAEEETFPIDDHHQLDLTEIVRQNTLLALPITKLCREDCPGLCPQCGHDLSLGSCDCKPEVIDSRFQVLVKLLQDGSLPQGN